jgi:hypothetical protein
MLHKIDTTGWENNIAWCGPSAVSTLTGASLMHTHSRAAFYRNQSIGEVKALHVKELILMLREYGLGAKQIDLKERFKRQPTLGTFMSKRTPYEKAMPVLISLTSHFVCAQYGFACDNWTLNPVPFEEFPKPRRLVNSAWIVVKDKNL